MGIEIEEPYTDYLDTLLESYLSIGVLTSSGISGFARSTLKDAIPLDDPDNPLLKWMEYEEKLCKHLEIQLVVALRLQTGAYS